MKNTLSNIYMPLKNFIIGCSMVFMVMTLSGMAYAIDNKQHDKYLSREDYKLSYEFYQQELNNVRSVLDLEKFKKISNDINKDIDLEVKYIAESHPFSHLSG